MYAGAPGVQKMVLEPLEQDLSLVISHPEWMLRTVLESSTRAVSALIL